MEAHGLGVRGVHVVLALWWAATGAGCSNASAPDELPSYYGDDRVEVEVGSAGAALWMGSEVRLTIPKGALESPVQVRLARVTAGDLEAREPDQRRISRLVAFEPHGLEFTRPVEIELRISDDGVPDDRIDLVRLNDEMDDRWLRADSDGVRQPEPEAVRLARPEAERELLEGRRLSVRTEHFSVYAVVERAGGDPADAGAEAGAEAGNDAAEDGGDETGDGTPLQGYCARVAQYYFDHLARCYGSEPYPESYREEFTSRIEGRCLNASTAVRDGRLTYDPVAAQDCLEAEQGNDCTRSFLDIPACEDLFEGQVAPGGDCYPEESLVFTVGVQTCIEGHFCEQTDSCPGRCVAYPARGESCADGRCAPTDTCFDDVCQRKRLEGESCPADGDGPGCASGLRCHAVGDTEQCVLPASVGDECGDDRPCGGTATCIDGGCTIELAEGDPCYTYIPAHCADGTHCYVPFGQSEARCAPLLQADEPCSDTRQCVEGLFCPAETCEALPVDGEPCIDNRCAPGLVCHYDEPNPAVCRAPRAEGGSCLSNGFAQQDLCQAGLFCVAAGTCQPPGALGQPCAVFVRESCVDDDAWCSRETGLCTAPVGVGEVCNPLWTQACEPGLGCACGAAEPNDCAGVSPSPTPTDTCQPLLDEGASCLRDSECASDLCRPEDPEGTGPSVCQSPPDEVVACLP